MSAQCSMPSRLHVAFAIFLCVPAFSANMPIPKTEQSPLTSDQKQIVDTVRAVFKAASTDNVAQFDAITTSDFYIFDGGVRFNGEGITALIKVQHAAGKCYEWSVTEPDVHIRGNTAWITSPTPPERSTSNGWKTGSREPRQMISRLADRPLAHSSGVTRQFIWGLRGRPSVVLRLQWGCPPLHRKVLDMLTTHHSSYCLDPLST
jgi:hypothetical protein